MMMIGFCVLAASILSAFVAYRLDLEYRKVRFGGGRR